MSVRAILRASAALAAMLWVGVSVAVELPLAASARAAEMDKQMDWSRARLIAVQDGGRYKTMDSFARESMVAMYGKEHLPGLSPMASLMEWLFNRPAYADAPVIRVKDKGVKIHLTAHMPEAVRQRIMATGYMTPHELIDPIVQQRVAELEPRAIMNTAMRRVRNAESVARFLDRMARLVPDPTERFDPKLDDKPRAPWFTPDELRANLPEDVLAQAGTTRRDVARQFGGPVAEISPEQALAVIGPWARLQQSWLSGDAPSAQAALEQLAQILPTLAQPGIYPSSAQRAAEAHYYAMGKFTGGWVLYFGGMVLGVVALAGGYRWAWGASLALLLAAMGVHAYGIGLRWQILGRIPVANMFEAVVASAWCGVAVGLVLEMVFRTRVFLIASHATGFLSLVLGGFVIPGGGTITTIMGILDDLMLRIHTVLIIWSYALIFLAAVVALIYLFGYYVHTNPARSGLVGMFSAAGGAALLILGGSLFSFGTTEYASGLLKHAWVAPTLGGASIAALAVLAVLAWMRAGALELAGVFIFALCCGAMAIGNYMFIDGLGKTMLASGALWAVGNGIALARRREPGLTPALALPGGGSMSPSDFLGAKPLMAGALPGDEKTTKLPAWMHHFDWSHLIILNMVFVMLFVGIILGAVWADYSWGRPWGWDPKEVFAMNTWIIYAILIHTRFIVKNKGLWTAWLSVLGCLMMAFNWCFVNFFIVGLHSYA